MTAHLSQSISGWGRYPVEACQLYRPEKRQAIPSLIAQHGQSWIARGLGRSYGDTASNANGGVIDHTRLNRMIAFDEASGLLECEAGVSFAEIIEAFLPRGYFLPVTPGTKFVTVGGAIANDIHGKNHHRDGSFGRFVEDFTLLTPAGEVLVCSPTQHADVFWATLGGIGLTGMIISARFRLKRVPSAYVTVDYRRARNLAHALELFTEGDARYEHSVAWIDCLASGRSLGRSIVMQGNDAPRERLPAQISRPLALTGATKPGIPFDFPGFALNRLTVGAFNTLFYAKHRDATDRLVNYEPFFYPLDAIGRWNRMYGARGFVQYQVVFPDETALEGLTALLERFSRSGRSSFLAVLKRFGEGTPAPLSFPMKGYTLALDLPVAEGLLPWLRELDERVVALGGRVYLAKDATIDASTFRAMYPGHEAFMAVRRRLDPDGRLSSSMARRLGLVELA